jgi:CRISPR-associated protein Csd2
MKTAFPSSSPIINTHRYGILLVDGSYMNMQGDPDRGNDARQDDETGMGLFTAMMPKRKVRDALAMDGHDIYVGRGACFQRQNRAVAESVGVDFAGADDEEVTEDVDEEEEEKPAKAAKGKAAKKKKVRVNPADAEKIYQALCKKYIDARLFGQPIPSLPGTLRGPIQFGWGVSVDPVLPTRAAITRQAVATEKEEEKQNGANRMMGSALYVPYGLYRVHFYVNPADARHTGCTEADYDLFLDKLAHMFDYDRSSARPSSCVRGLFEFRVNENAKGVVHGEQLLEAVQVRRRDPNKVARAFSDYDITIPQKILTSPDISFRKIVTDVNPWLDAADVAAE